jgi:tRNA-specific 2-thiouridylase
LVIILHFSYTFNDATNLRIVLQNMCPVWYVNLMETIFVAMSGGVDSSFAAHLLKAKGYKVIGVTFQLLSPSPAGDTSKRTLCSSEAVVRAAKVARDLSIPHHVFDLRAEFEHHVIDKFVTEYRSGRTPNPCVLCNRHIKFDAFLQKALSLGADRIATGHYAIIENTPQGCTLRKGADGTKDQSYFLYTLEKETLDKILFPLGPFTKDQVRSHMKDLGSPLTATRESQDICFIQGGDYRGFLSRFLSLRDGPVYHIDGTLLGAHEGFHLYTIGQRKGLRIPYGQPLYVLEIRPDDNSLIVGPKECLRKTRVVASDINILESPKGSGTARVRYRQREEPCVYEVTGDSLSIEFRHPVYSVSPGQSVVVYQGDSIAVGGTITASD